MIQTRSAEACFWSVTPRAESLKVFRMETGRWWTLEGIWYSFSYAANCPPR